METLTTRRTGKKLRRHSLRYQSWNYAGTGWYHVTICTRDSVPYFGKMGDERMHLNRYRQIVKEEWKKTAELRPSVGLDEFCIMPDHFHGIIAISNDTVADPESLVLKDHWQKGCLSSIVNQFKGACTKRIREAGCARFAWQRNFNDHIIRNEKDLERIRKYIRSNPEAYVFGREGWREYDQ